MRFTSSVPSSHPSAPVIYETSTLRPVRTKNPELEAESNLFRCMSDASLVKRRRGRVKSAAQRERERQHRFSINGHFYNYKVRAPAQDLSSPRHFFTFVLPKSFASFSLTRIPPDLHLHPILWHCDQSSYLQQDDHRPGHRTATEQVQGEFLCHA